VRAALEGAATRRPEGLAAVLSPWMTCEEAYVLAAYLKGLSPKVRLALGPVRVAGEDDRYPKDVHGRPVEPASFVIRAEKCPNRRGIEILLRHFQGEVVGFDRVLADVQSGSIDSLYFVGGDPRSEMTEAQGAQLEKLKLLIVQDLLPSPASARAHFLLAGGSFAEREGTFVNHAGLAQTIRRSVASPGEARPDGRIVWELAGRRGLFHAPTVRREMGQAVRELEALASGEIGPQGVLLNGNLIPPQCGRVK